MIWLTHIKTCPDSVNSSRASYGVSIVRILEKIDRVITAWRCIFISSFSSDLDSQGSAGTGNAQTSTVHLSQRSHGRRDQGHPQHPRLLPGQRDPWPLPWPHAAGSRDKTSGRHGGFPPWNHAHQAHPISPPCLTPPYRLSSPFRSPYRSNLWYFSTNIPPTWPAVGLPEEVQELDTRATFN